MQTETLIVLILWLILAAFAFGILFLRWNFNYWGYDDLKGPDPLTYFGNLPSAVAKKRHVMYDIWDIYVAYKHTDYFVGIYDKRTPQLLILSPKLARQIYVTHFKHFHDNDKVKMISEKKDFLFANNPFVAGGEKWKQRRSEITPGLTLGRIKSVFPVTLEICQRMTHFIEKLVRASCPGGVDAKDLCSRFTADIIADCVLGIQSNSFMDRNSPLLVMQNQMFEHSFWYMSLVGLLPGITRLYKWRFLTKQFQKYFTNLMQKAIDMRKSQSAKEGNEERADFLNYLLQLQVKKDLSNMEISAHAMTFLLDGFETVSSVLAHTLLMLARHPEAQHRLRREIKDQLGNTRNFDLIHDLPYLNACIHETLRFFPVTFHAHKVCTEPIIFKNKNGNNLKVRKGITVVIPHYQIMMDPEIYENVTEFQPERFLEENGGVKKYFDMGAYWGYGDGPRICVGIRFGLVQIKAALVEILTKFRVKPNPKTRSDYKFDPKYFLARLDGGVFLDFESLFEDNIIYLKNNS